MLEGNRIKTLISIRPCCRNDQGRIYFRPQYIAQGRYIFFFKKYAQKATDLSPIIDDYDSATIECHGTIHYALCKNTLPSMQVLI